MTRSTAAGPTAAVLMDLAWRPTVVKAILLGGQRGAGRRVLIDDEDAALVAGYSWCVLRGVNTDYAIAYIPGSGHRGRMILMHVLIMGHRGIDHANGNGLDNQRHNLRDATKAQNAANSQKAAGCSSRFKGVCLTRWGWQAYIKVDRRRRHLGYFADETDAARAYDAAALEAWGSYARLNFPPS